MTFRQAALMSFALLSVLIVMGFDLAAALGLVTLAWSVLLGLRVV